jgi:galactose mutarotase-like enzyme
LYALVDDRRMAIETDRHRVEVSFGRNYPYAQVFAPPDQAFVCLEPMTAPTNALVTGEVPVIEAGESSGAEFTIRISDQ